MNINISSEVLEMNDKHIVKFMKNNDTKKLLKSFNGRTDIGFRNGMIVLLNKEAEIKEKTKLGIQIPIRSEKRNINTEHCIKCTMKHLAAAIVEMGELRKGYWNTDHEIYCAGNLNEASEQIDAYSNKTAMTIRGIRIDIFETKKEVTEQHIQDAKDIFWDVKEMLKNPPELKPKKECGCNKRKKTGDNEKRVS